MFRSVYFHFPFCEAKCHYCDFYSIGRERTRESDPDRFIRALGLEVEQKAHLLAPTLDTLFLGGGTPSMTPPEQMQKAFEAMWKHTSLEEMTEWTMEANPSSIDPKTFRGYREIGINRVSMGVQSMNPEHLLQLGRVHSREAALRALDTVFSSGFDNVSVDLLCGVPHQTLADIDQALQSLLKFPIAHLSCYLLTLPPHHKMYKDLPGEEMQLQHLLHVHQRLEAAGFEHYEISNFAKPGKRAKHNLSYWQGQSYLGFGPSAHSYDSSKFTRWKNVSSLHKYCGLIEENKTVEESVEELSKEQRRLEQWMLALRLNDGFSKSWLITPTQQARASLFQKEGLLEPHPLKFENLRLTPKGFALSDQVIQSLV